MTLKIYAHWSHFPKSEWRWPNFSPEEMACRGTGRLAIDPRSMDMLQELRERLDAPMAVNSAYRSPEHNARVGGAKNSMHLVAQAFDVRMENHDPGDYILLARAVGFRGIGTYPAQGFVHVDTRGYDASWGKPFPARQGASRFAPEPVRAPVKDSAKQGAGAAVAIVAVERVLDEAAPILPDQWLTWAGIAVALAALAIILWRNFRPNERGV